MKKPGARKPGRPRGSKTRQSTQPVEDREVMTLQEAAEFLHCHPATLYRMLRTGEIAAFRLGSDWRFTRDALDRWIKSRQMKVE